MLGWELGKELKEAAVAAFGIDGGAPEMQGIFHAEQTANPAFGDYSANAAMKLARTLRRPPMAIAEQLSRQLEARGMMDGLLLKAEAAAPGFVNLHIDWQRWASRSFEAPPVPSGSVIVEHTSINPNKAAHVGHLRNSCIGDTLVRMLRHTGRRVEVHNYIDDLGNQLADTLVGLLNVPYKGNYERFGDFCWDVYAEVNRLYEREPDMTEKRREMMHQLEEGEGNGAWLGKITAERIVREHVAEMEAFGITYDLLVWESDIVREGFWEAAFSLLQSTPVFVRETDGPNAGCWVLKQEAGTGQKDSAAGTSTDEHPAAPDDPYSSDKVLVRSSGILTYTAKDIAYHLWKFGLLNTDFRYSAFASGLWTTDRSGAAMDWGRADTVINVIDHRQEYPQAMVRKALEALGYAGQAEKLRHVAYGVVSLSPASAAGLGIDVADGKASYAMSGRQGIGIKAADLLGRMERSIGERAGTGGLPARLIAAAAIRYYLLRYNLGTEVVFDAEQAMETTGNTGVYLMYAHARAASVLRKGEAAGLKGTAGEDTEAPPFPQELHEAERLLLRQLAAWQETLHEAAESLAPNLICAYSHTLASLFNQFYTRCPVLKAAPGLAGFRLWLAGATLKTLAEALGVLGLPAPERL